MRRINVRDEMLELERDEMLKLERDKKLELERDIESQPPFKYFMSSAEQTLQVRSRGLVLCSLRALHLLSFSPFFSVYFRYICYEPSF